MLEVENLEGCPEHTFLDPRKEGNDAEQAVEVHRECLHLRITSKINPVLSGHQLEISASVEVEVWRYMSSEPLVDVAQRLQLLKLAVFRFEQPKGRNRVVERPDFRRRDDHRVPRLLDGVRESPAD